MNRAILIIGDHESAPHETCRAVVPTFTAVRATDALREAVDLIEVEEPSVVVLTFQEVALAEEAYLRLFRLSNKFRTLSHRTLLLCPATEAEKAYAACRQNVFDDYLVDRPLQDGHRLLLAIHQALAAVTERGRPGAAEIARQAMGQVEETLARVTRALERGEDIRRRSGDIYALLERELKENVMGLARKMAEPPYAPFAQVRDEQGLRTSLGEYADQNVVGAVGRARRELDRHVASWQEEMGEDRRRLASSAEGMGRIRADFARPHILVVEDDEEYRATLVDLLSTEGFAVTATSNGMRAVALLSRYAFDVTLMDYKLPGMNGLETLEMAAHGRENGLPPVIMLTGFGTRDLVRKSLGVGAVDFMVKPVQKRHLLERISRHLGRPATGTPAEMPQ